MALPITVGSTATTFANGEFTVAANTPVTLYLTRSADGGSPSGVDFELAHKTAGGVYVTLIVLNASNINEKGTVSAAGTWAVRRLATTNGASAGLEAV